MENLFTNALHLFVSAGNALIVNTIFMWNSVKLVTSEKVCYQGEESACKYRLCNDIAMAVVEHLPSINTFLRTKKEAVVSSSLSCLKCDEGYFISTIFFVEEYFPAIMV